MLGARVSAIRLLFKEGQEQFCLFPLWHTHFLNTYGLILFSCYVLNLDVVSICGLGNWDSESLVQLAMWQTEFKNLFFLFSYWGGQEIWIWGAVSCACEKTEAGLQSGGKCVHTLLCVHSCVPSCVHSCVHSCVCTPVCTPPVLCPCICRCLFLSVCAFGGQRSLFSVLLNHSLPYFLR